MSAVDLRPASLKVGFNYRLIEGLFGVTDGRLIIKALKNLLNLRIIAL